MTLRDLVVTKYSKSNHMEEFSSQHEDVELRKNSETVSSSYENASTATNMAYLSQTVVLCELRHEVFETSLHAGPSENGLVSKWRPRERMKTGCVALVLNLNIGVDPPDVIKIPPCAKMECWIDPTSMAPQKALHAIGEALERQYAKWQPRARYKCQLDATLEEVRKLVIPCRKFAKLERVLFHYNGHGVPKPTVNGEIWFYNKSYTQYIPLKISELYSWLKSPSIAVYDCSGAGAIINSFLEFHNSNASSSSDSLRDCILLAACEAHETLPQSSDFPADLFTSCLTTPIKIALRWLCPRSLLRDSLDFSLIDQIPGLQNDRKTLLGELNWIFTAITDTIAWNVLPHDLFHRLFRQDLLVASLFRNLLLAERIMRSANCAPVSYPMLPPTHQHHMWDAWDMAAEICLSQLPSLLADPNAEFQPSPFFADQLTAFEIWLDHGSERRKPPEQLPIVLQVLLSQCHRLRALVLLGRFLDMGSWAVNLALSVGIFPYVLKLLKTVTPELRHILVFIWTKILALDKSCQVDLVKDEGHNYFIRFLDSLEAYPEHRAMAAFVLAVIVDGHKQGQKECMEAGLMHLCLKHLQISSSNDAQTDSLFLQWLCLCLGKLWEDFPEAQLLGLQADAPAIFASLLSKPQPEVRASAVFGLSTLLDVEFDSPRDGVGGDEECDYDETNRVEVSIIENLLNVVSDGSPLVRAEVAIALARFAFVHKKQLKSIAAAYLKPLANSVLTPSTYMPHASMIPSQISPLLRVGSGNLTVVRDTKVTTISSSPLASAGILNGSPLSDDGIMNESANNGSVNHYSRPKQLDNALYTLCVGAMYTLLNDPSPRVARLGRRVLSLIGYEQIITKPSKATGNSSRPVEPITALPSPFAGIARSSSWFDMNGGGHLPLTFRTPPVSPPRPNYLSGMRRVYSLDLLSAPDSGLANPILGSGVTSVGSVSERSFLPESTIYHWSCGHFSKPILTVTDDSEEILAKREERENFALDHITKCQRSHVSKLSNQIASWDTKFETGPKTVLLQPFSPIVIAADERERIRVWNYEEATLLNGFDNHDFPDKGISKLCLVNELDDSLLLAASCNGNIRIWKDYSIKGKQKLVTAFSSIQGHRPGVKIVNAVVDWQQQSGCVFASGEMSSIMVWDLDKEQFVHNIPSMSDCSISALAASPIHNGQFVVGYTDGYVRLFDIRAPEMLVCATRPHTKKEERVVGIGFQPGLAPAKIISASQAGEIKFLDIRNKKDAYNKIDTRRGSLTSLAVHRHAPIISSGSSKQIIEVFNLEGDQLGTVLYYSTFMAQKIGAVNCLAFHPYEPLLAAGAADACVSIYADENRL